MPRRSSRSSRADRSAGNRDRLPRRAEISPLAIAERRSAQHGIALPSCVSASRTSRWRLDRFSHHLVEASHRRSDLALGQGRIAEEQGALAIGIAIKVEGWTVVDRADPDLTQEAGILFEQ